MSREFVEIIRGQTEVMFHNLSVSMKTCEWDYLICGTPAWRYMYHTLHSCDRWYINPQVFTEPDIHAENLDKVDLPCDRVLTADELWGYFYRVRSKIMDYLDGIDDAMLGEIPDKCEHTRLQIILAQIRHFCVHVGIFNGVTIAKKDRYPMAIGLSAMEYEQNREKLYDE